MEVSTSRQSQPLAQTTPGRLGALLLSLAALTLMTGCPQQLPRQTTGVSDHSTTAPEKPRNSAAQHGMLIVLIDETASFVATGSWEQSLKVLVQAVNYMRARDKICIIGIDHRSGDMDDVRLPVTALPAGALPAVSAKAEILETIKNLKPRETSSGFIGSNGKVRGKPWGSDVEGVIDFAALLAQRNAEGMKVRVLAFSDFDNNVSSSAGGATTGSNTFPPGSIFQAFFVINPDKKAKGNWEKRIGAWAQWMSNRGLQTTSEAFKMPAESMQPTTIREFMRR